MHKNIRRGSLALAAAVAATMAVGPIAMASPDEGLLDPAGTTARVGGVDRYETAVKASQARTWGPSVIIAAGNEFADSLVSGPLADRLDAPILLTGATNLPNATAAEVERLATAHEDGITVHVIGGTGAVSDDVVTQLAAIAGVATVERVGGEDRYGTASLIAERTLQAYSDQPGDEPGDDSEDEEPGETEDPTEEPTDPEEPGDDSEDEEPGETEDPTEEPTDPEAPTIEDLERAVEDAQAALDEAEAAWLPYFEAERFMAEKAEAQADLDEARDVVTQALQSRLDADVAGASYAAAATSIFSAIDAVEAISAEGVNVRPVTYFLGVAGVKVEEVADLEQAASDAMVAINAEVERLKRALDLTDRSEEERVALVESIITEIAGSVRAAREAAEAAEAAAPLANDRLVEAQERLTTLLGALPAQASTEAPEDTGGDDTAGGDDPVGGDGDTGGDDSTGGDDGTGDDEGDGDETPAGPTDAELGQQAASDIDAAIASVQAAGTLAEARAALAEAYAAEAQAERALLVVSDREVPEVLTELENHQANVDGHLELVTNIETRLEQARLDVETAQAELDEVVRTGDDDAYFEALSKLQRAESLVLDAERDLGFANGELDSFIRLRDEAQAKWDDARAAVTEALAVYDQAVRDLAAARGPEDSGDAEPGEDGDEEGGDVQALVLDYEARSFGVLSASIDPSAVPVFVASGEKFPDALAAGAAAAQAGGVLLLTPEGQLGSAVRDYLDTYEPTTVYAIGGPAAQVLGEQADEAIVGADRYGTAVAAAEEFFEDFDRAAIASGVDFADAVVAGGFIANADGPLLLTRPDVLVGATKSAVAGHDRQVDIFVFGGSSAITDEVLGAVEQARQAE